jgi:CRISPR-associated protein Cas2
MFTVIAYDVPAKRTEVFRKLLSRYLTHEQNSVFMGRLSESTYRTMMADLSKIAREGERLLSILSENQNNVHVRKLRKNRDNGRLEIVPADVHERGFDII